MKPKIKKTASKVPNTLEARGTYSSTIMEIVKLFIYPLMSNFERYETTSESFNETLKTFFNEETRSVNWYRATKDFKIPGEKYVAGNLTKPGLGLRQIKQGDLLLVVEDLNLDFVKIEVCRKNSEENYKLKKHEWKFVKEKVRIV